MQNLLTKTKPNYFIHLIYACSFLLVVLSILCYLVWEKHQLAMQRQAEVERQNVQKRFEAAQKIAQEKERKMKILNCTIEASKAYSAEWAAACKEQANKIQTNLNNCINEAASFVKYVKTSYTTESDTRNLYNLKVAQCRSIYIPNPKPSCTLPSSIASGVNNGFEELKKICHEMNV